MTSENEESEIVEAKSRKQDDEMDPLKIGSLVEIILGFLDVNSIKAARQVNELFSIEGAKLLLVKCYVKIPSDARDEESPTKNETMDKFQAFLSFKSSKISNIPNIIINDIEDVELWKSLGVLGEQVKSFKLNIFDDKPELLQNLLNLVPKLKYLNLSKLNDKQCFTTLKVLTSVMSEPERDGKPVAVSSITLMPTNMEEFEDLEKFSDCKNIMINGRLMFGMVSNGLNNVPQLETRTAIILSKLLLSSRNTLESLTLFHPEVYLSLVQFPCMTKLSQLLLMFGEQTPNLLCEYKFSPCFRFSEKVPNLNVLLIVLGFTTVEYWPDANFSADLFEKTGLAPSIKRTVIVDITMRLAVDPFFQTFPNTEYFNFNVTTAERTKTVFHSVCKQWKNIKKMEMNIMALNQDFGELAELDSILTGFAPETVNKIRNSEMLAPFTYEELEKLRVNPSILDLKELEKLRIDLTVEAEAGIFLPRRFLAIAGEHAFKFMKKEAKIGITFKNKPPAFEDARAALDEVSKLPNVTLKFVEPLSLPVSNLE